MTTEKSRRSSKIILIILVICAAAGLILSVILFNRNPSRTYVAASLQFSFNGAGEGKAPNGYPFDVNGIYSEEVLTNALETSGLTGTYTTDQIKENLTITGVYPEDFIRRMTAYTSLLDADADQQAAMADYHATQYSVVLYHDFDTKISGDQLKTLLNNILEAYRSYFFRTCAFSLQKTDPIENLQEYDYTQQLKAIREAADQQNRFAKEMAELAPAFRMDRKGFDDIVIRYASLESEIDRLNASITLNSVSKDRNRLQKQYEMELRALNRRLESNQEELRRIGELVSAYEKDGIIYVSTSSALQHVTGNASDTYDKLVAKKKELTDSIAAINADIAGYQGLLKGMTDSGTETLKTQEAEGAEETASSVELNEAELRQLADTAEKQIETLAAKKASVTSDFTAMLEAYARQEINENTVMVSKLKYRAPSLLSGEFIVKAVKTAGPVCAAGMLICIVWMIVKGSRKRRNS